MGAPSAPTPSEGGTDESSLGELAVPWQYDATRMSDDRQQTFDVVGMSCEHCVAAVKDEVGRIDGVSGVDVDLASGAMVVHGGAIDGAAVSAALETAGYSLAT